MERSINSSVNSDKTKEEAPDIGNITIVSVTTNVNGLVRLLVNGITCQFPYRVKAGDVITISIYDPNSEKDGPWKYITLEGKL